MSRASGALGGRVAACVIAVAIVAACGGPGASPTLTPGTGTLAPDAPSAPDFPRDVAVACAAGPPALDAGRVRVSADGVRFVVTGPVGWVFGVTTDQGHDGVQLSASPASITLQVRPGDAGISCADPSLPEIGPTTLLVVEDPDGWYRPVEPKPAGGDCLSIFATPVVGATGARGDPVALARIALADLRPGDIVERGGFPANAGTVRVVRAGVVIGRLTYIDDGQGGWLVVSATLCDGLRMGGGLAG